MVRGLYQLDDDGSNGGNCGCCHNHFFFISYLKNFFLPFYFAFLLFFFFSFLLPFFFFSIFSKAKIKK